MELRHLRYLRAVIAMGSVSKAAKVLHLTQPTLSRQLSDLEAAVGCRLMVRSQRGVVPTAAGTGLLAYIEPILLQIDRLSDVARTYANARILLNMGLPPGVPHSWFLDFSAALARTADNVQLALHEASSDDQRGLLRDGVLDIGLLHAKPVDLHSRLVLTQEFGVVVRPDSVLSSKGRVAFRELEGLRVMAHAAGEISEDEERLREAALAAGVEIDWLFRRFAEHSYLIALHENVDALLITRPSSEFSLPGWHWIPLSRDEHFDAVVRTWAAWRDRDAPFTAQSVAAFREASGRYV